VPVILRGESVSKLPKIASSNERWFIYCGSFREPEFKDSINIFSISELKDSISIFKKNL